MAVTPPRIHVAKLLLWLALLLMAIAQCLPWEIVPVRQNRPFDYDWASTSLSQTEHTWLIVHDPSRANWTWEGSDPGANYITSQLGVRSRLQTLPVTQAAELWLYTRLTVHNARHARDLLTWSMMNVIIWIVASISMLVLPFIAGILSRARPLLWLTLFFASSMLIWMARNLVRAVTSYPEARIENIGFGQWFSMAALALTIAALLLLPSPRRNAMRPPPST